MMSGFKNQSRTKIGNKNSSRSEFVPLFKAICAKFMEIKARKRLQVRQNVSLTDEMRSERPNESVRLRISLY